MMAIHTQLVIATCLITLLAACDRSRIDVPPYVESRGDPIVQAQNLVGEAAGNGFSIHVYEAPPDTSAAGEGAGAESGRWAVLVVNREGRDLEVFDIEARDRSGGIVTINRDETPSGQGPRLFSAAGVRSLGSGRMDQSVPAGTSLSTPVEIALPRLQRTGLEAFVVTVGADDWRHEIAVELSTPFEPLSND